MNIVASNASMMQYTLPKNLGGVLIFVKFGAVGISILFMRGCCLLQHG